MIKESVWKDTLFIMVGLINPYQSRSEVVDRDSIKKNKIKQTNSPKKHLMVQRQRQFLFPISCAEIVEGLELRRSYLIRLSDFGIYKVHLENVNAYNLIK